MTTIKPENAWFNQIQLSDREEVLLSYPANHTQGKRAVGGKLFVTNCRLAFAPNRIDANFGGDTWELPLSDFASAGTDNPRMRITEIFSGAWRTRLAIHASGGGVEYFVVCDPEEISAALTTAIRTRTEHGEGGKASPATS